MERKTIGIDLGHCETAAVLPRQNLNRTGYEVRRLAVQQKDQVLLTQVLLTGAQMAQLRGNLRPSRALLESLGEIRIGNNLPLFVAEGERFLYFKTPPGQFDQVCANSPEGIEAGITHGMVLACFCYALIKNIFQYNTGDLEPEELEEADLLVGCPSTADWTSQEARDAYAQLVQNATGVHSVRIIPESRAAMYSSIENGGRRVSARRGAIVFDFGSSTADCTYMLLGREILEFSWTLGATEIERQMVMAALEEAVKANGRFDVDMASFIRCESDLRMAKEAYYNGVFGQEDHDMICSFRTQDQQTVRQLVTINPEFMDRITGQREIQITCDSTTPRTGTWQSLCRDFLEQARQMLAGRGVPVDTIVLTGGASKMAFIKTICREVFKDNPEETILVEENPSHTVSNGLGWVAAADAQEQESRAEAKRILEQDDSANVSALRQALSNRIFGLICQVAKQSTREWADQEEEQGTLRMLEERINAYLNSGGFRGEILQLLTEETELWKERLSAAMERAVNQQVTKIYSEQIAASFLIPTDLWQELCMTNLQFGEFDVSKALSSLDMTSFFWRLTREIKSISLWIAAGALAVKSFGLSLLVAWFADTLTDHLLTDHDLDKPRKQKTRRKVAEEVETRLLESRAGLMKELEEALAQYTAAYPSLIERALGRAFDIVTLKNFGGQSG